MFPRGTRTTQPRSPNTDCWRFLGRRGRPHLAKFLITRTSQRRIFFCTINSLVQLLHRRDTNGIFRSAYAEQAQETGAVNLLGKRQQLVLIVLSIVGPDVIVISANASAIRRMSFGIFGYILPFIANA